MTKFYKIFSWAYRFILGLLTLFCLFFSLIFSSFGREEINFNSWLLLLYCLITLTMIAFFHELNNANKYRIFIHILVCLLTSFSLGFLIFLTFSVFKNSEGNLIGHSVLLISIFINAAFLFYLINDKKYNHNG